MCVHACASVWVYGSVKWGWDHGLSPVHLAVSVHARMSVSFTEDLADVGVVHVGEGLEDLSPLVLGPHHESVHRPFDVWFIAAAAAALPEYPGVGHAGGA